jgi:calcium permeable stress-gated cation channel
MEDILESDESCMTPNKTNLITNLYGGIPETLILNVIAWLFLLILFAVLRQQAWDFGRLALVNSHGEKQRWTQLFYAHGSEEETTLRSNTRSSIMDSGFFSWMLTTVKLSHQQILAHCGPDAVHYLSFQQHLIFVMAIITVVVIVIILPINFQGK